MFARHSGEGKFTKRSCGSSSGMTFAFQADNEIITPALRMVSAGQQCIFGSEGFAPHRDIRESNHGLFVVPDTTSRAPPVPPTPVSLRFRPVSEASFASQIAGQAAIPPVRPVAWTESFALPHPMGGRGVNSHIRLVGKLTEQGCLSPGSAIGPIRAESLGNGQREH